METTEQIAEKIMDYLRKNPAAGDTLEGISKWWLRTEYIEQSVDKVAAALDILIEKGVLQRKEVAGVGSLYFVKGAS